MIEAPKYKNIEEFLEHAFFYTPSTVVLRAQKSDPNRVIKKLKWFWNGDEEHEEDCRGI